MEGACQFHDRILRDTSRRVGWPYAGRVRRSGDHSQVLLDASCFRIRGATRHYGRGSCPRRARGNCLARWTETQVTVAIAPPAPKMIAVFPFKSVAILLSRPLRHDGSRPNSDATAEPGL